MNKQRPINKPTSRSKKARSNSKISPSDQSLWAVVNRMDATRRQSFLQRILKRIRRL